MCHLHFWSLNLTEDELDQLEELLSPEELARAQRAISPQVHRRFVAARGRLRILLAQHLSVPPQQLVFALGPWGKPYLPYHPNCHFNLSHSLDHAALAISDHPVGLDIEDSLRQFSTSAIAEQILAKAELDSFQQIPHPHQREALLLIWSAKEALLKLLGTGMSQSMQLLILPSPLPNTFTLPLPPSFLPINTQHQIPTPTPSVQLQRLTQTTNILGWLATFDSASS